MANSYSLRRRVTDPGFPGATNRSPFIYLYIAVRFCKAINERMARRFRVLNDAELEISTEVHMIFPGYTESTAIFVFVGR
jgi:hypothetical protein